MWLRGASLLTSKGWALAQGTAFVPSLPQAIITKARCKPCTQPSAVLMPTPLPLETALLVELVRPVGRGGKEWTWGCWVLDKALDFLGIVWRLLLTQDCRGTFKDVVQVRLSEVGGGGVGVCACVFNCSRPPVWTVVLCTLATPTLTISNVVSQCWSAQKTAAPLMSPRAINLCVREPEASAGLFSVSSQW